MLAQLNSGAVLGVDAYTVRVEVDLGRGMPCMHVVGLPESAVREGRERVTAALANVDFRLPAGRITVNLAPADIPKGGSAFDLPVALGLLAAAGEIPASALDGLCVIGELGLDGTVRPVRGVLPIAARCFADGMTTLLCPPGHAAEAGVVEGLEVLPVPSLELAIAHLLGKARLSVAASNGAAPPLPGTGLDFAHVLGQDNARIALEIAAAGGHNIFMTGPPGAGKSMLARRLPGILPPLTHAEAVAATKVHSVAGTLRPGCALLPERPFRAPHHSVSEAGLIGGGSPPRPGEVSLAHHGVLFLDELPQVQRHVLESLRQPMEDGCVLIGRARMALTFPARFMLVAAMNPCPCGYHGSGTGRCICKPADVDRYARRVSGPLLDRVDLHVEVPAIPPSHLLRRFHAETSESIRQRVVAARERQLQRAGRPNAELNPAETAEYCRLDAAGERAIRGAIRKLGLSARGYHRVCRVARTIADLKGADRISEAHVKLAAQYQDRQRPRSARA
ncbi:MAG TPA: YifB family Mg chelatase-like AAA ATPase [Longimicrobiales bacterium]|nr:YifB family Mg chelatase-like AAA ATPase [Longimicrobiales bacterium]